MTNADLEAAFRLFYTGTHRDVSLHRSIQTYSLFRHSPSPIDGECVHALQRVEVDDVQAATPVAA